MLIPLADLEKWENLNGDLRQVLSLVDTQTVRLAPNFVHGLFEVTFGLAQTFLHKKSVAFLKGETPFLEPIIALFTKTGYQMQVSPQRDLGDPAAYVSQLKKDTLFVVACLDHGITAESHDVKTLEKLLGEQKIFLILLQHAPAAMSFGYQEFLPYTGILQACTQAFTVGVFGERLKFQSLTSPYFDWNQDPLRKIESLKRDIAIDKAAVKAFESRSFTGFSAFLNSESRIWDRAILLSRQVNAEAWAEILREMTSGSAQEIFTTSFCDLEIVRGFDWWKLPEPRAEIISGLLVIDCRLLKDPEFFKQVQKAHDKVLQMQGDSRP